jgi:putative ABC transport system permease protein
MYEADIEMFILSGVFVVTAGIILFINNSNQIMQLITNIWSAMGRPIATVKTASSYPMKNKFRTGMTIYMFALIVFTITVMSMIVGVLSANIERITEEQMGGVEVLGVSSSQFHIDDIELTIEENENLNIEDFNGIYVMTAGNSILENGETDPETNENLSMELTLCGVDEQFKECDWDFQDRMDGFDSDIEVWDAVQSDPRYVVVDGSFTGEDGFGPEPPPITLSAGDTLYVFCNGIRSEKTVIGVLEQNLISGVFLSKDTAEEEFNITKNTLFLFDIADGVDQEELALDIERELGLETHVLSVFVKMVTRSMEQMFDLFSAFMGLGLVVGIAGLGIITLRAVHERRLEIGMMRAIGFQRHSVTWSFLMEAGFIAITGILLGSLLGIGLGYTLWFDDFRPYDYDFFIPWVKILIVGGIALFATLAFTIPPSFSASKVAPAEALRYD